MKKTNVLELMKKNYSASYECQKLKSFFFEVPIFSKRYTRDAFSYVKVFDELFLRNWPFRQTYVSTKEIFSQNGLDIDFSKKYTDDQLVDFIELIDNILHVKPNSSVLSVNYDLEILGDNYKLLLEILDALIRNLGLDEKKSPEGWIALIPKNETLDAAIEDFSTEVQWEIVSYLKIKEDDLETKRKQLAHLATELYIEQDKKEEGYKPFDTIMNECTLILNNLHIRHNNETGKWENEVVKTIDKKEAIEYCDILYNKMLEIILMRKDLSKQAMIDKLSKSLKSK